MRVLLATEPSGWGFKVVARRRKQGREVKYTGETASRAQTWEWGIHTNLSLEVTDLAVS